MRADACCPYGSVRGTAIVMAEDGGGSPATGTTRVERDGRPREEA